MKFYLVGGAVRDMQMNIQSNDYDFVVVGASPDDFKDWECVGKDFPVFLEPTHGWEVALARVERKVGAGYTGFEADWKGVTLEQDLERRDLTINAMAIEVNFEASVLIGEPVCVGQIIDPFGGLQDIEQHVLRNVSDAFKEDPVRFLRVGRFSARFPKFLPSLRLMNLCESMERSGELENLVPERVWAEMEKGLKAKEPRYFFWWLESYNVPVGEIFRKMSAVTENNDYHQEANVFEHTLMVLDHAVENWQDPEINFACMMHDVGKPYCYQKYGKGNGHDKEGVSLVLEFCSKWKVPNSYRDLAVNVCEHHQKIHTIMGRGDKQRWTKPNKIFQLFEKSSALSHPQRFAKMLKACESDSKGRIGIAAHNEYHQRPYLLDCLETVLALDTKAISKQLLSEGKSGKAIGAKIREARIHAIRKVQNKWKQKVQ